MLSCKFKSKASDLNTLLKEVKSQGLNDTLAEQELSAYVSKTYPGDVLAINFVNKKLNQSGYNFLLELPTDIEETQLSDKFRHLDASSSEKILNIFKGNRFALNYIMSKFNKSAFKYCRINNSENADYFPIVDNNKKLRENIAAFKNELALELITRLGLNPEEYLGIGRSGLIGIFHDLYGADAVLYDKLMNEVFDSKKLDFKKYDLSELTSKDVETLDIFYYLFALNNFDNLLNISMDGVIDYNSLESGNLQRLDYSIKGFSEQQDLQLKSDIEYENSLNSLDANIKQIVSSIPRLSINRNARLSERKITYNENSGNLQLPDILLTFSFIKINLPLFEEVFGELDFYENPLESLETVLSGFQNLVLSQKKLTPKELLLLGKLGYMSEVLVSLQDYLYNNKESKIIKNTLSISEINNHYYEYGKKLSLDIENYIIDVLLDNDTPAFLEYEKDGSLYKQDSNQIIDKAYILKSLKNNTYFTALSLLRKTAYNICLLNDDEYEKVFKSNSEAIKRLLNIDFSLQWLMSVLEKSDLIKKLITNIKDGLDKIRESNPNLSDLIKGVDEVVLKSLGPNISFSDLGKILNYAIGSGPVPTFYDRNGNQLGVYRTTSMMFDMLYWVKKFKNSQYLKNRRHRLNLFVRFPQLLTNNNNEGYLSTVAIPLTLGDSGENIEARKLPAFILVYRQFVGDFLSLLTSTTSYGSIGMPSSQVAVQLGTYSDKTTLLEILVNMQALLQDGKYNFTIGNIFIEPGKEKVLSPKRIATFDWAFRSMNYIDQMHRLLADWSGILDDKDFNYNFSEVEKFLNKDLLEKFLLVLIKNDTNEAIESKQMKDFLKEMKIIAEYLNKKLLELNSYLSKLKKLDLFIYTKIASDKGIKFVNGFHADTYFEKTDSGKISKLLVNQLFVSDFLKYTGNSEILPLDSFIKYNEQMCNKFLNEEYVIDGKTTKFKDFVDINGHSVLLKARAFSKLDVFKNTPIKNILASLGEEYEDLDGNRRFKGTDVLLRSYLLFTNFIRNSLLDITVKLAYFDGKGGYLGDYQNERNSREIGTSKRNNTFTATYKRFRQNTLRGINLKTKISIIQDVKFPVFNPMGEIVDIDEYDGVGWVDPIQMRMEDYSLGNSTSTEVKKTFATLIDDYSAGELKWASNAITMKMIRNSLGCSIDVENLLRKMWSIPFPEETNLTKFYYNNSGEKVIISTLSNKNLYFRKGFNLYEIISFEKTGNSTYSLSIAPVDLNGNIIGSEEVISAKINNLFDLYLALGGKNSLELINGSLDSSELIFDIIYEMVVRVGDKISEESIYNLRTINLLLRNCFIGILCTESANKRGIINMTENRVYRDSAIPLNFSEIKLVSGGKLLDADHNAENSTITLGTLLISSTALTGVSYSEVNDLYKSLATVIRNGSDTFSKFTRDIKNLNYQELNLAIVLKIYLDLKISGLNFNIQSLLNSKTNSGNIPLSLLLNDVVKAVVVDVNHDMIKHKDTGLLGVIRPTSGFFLLYHINGKTYQASDIMRLDRILSPKFTGSPNLILNIANKYGISFDELLQRIILADLNSELIINDNSRFGMIEMYADTNQIQLTEAMEQVFDILASGDIKRMILFAEDYPNENNILLLSKESPKSLSPGDVVYDEDGNKYFAGIIDGKNQLLKIRNKKYVYRRIDIPSDFKPVYTNITDEDNQTSNEYTSVEADISFDLTDMFNKEDRYLEELKKLGQEQNEKCYGE